jgi:hypothetical protein
MDEWMIFDKEMKKLEQEARELEAWLLENTESADFNKANSKYNDVLFRLATKKEIHENRERGTHEPETFSLPRFINKSENFKR